MRTVHGVTLFVHVSLSVRIRPVTEALNRVSEGVFSSASPPTPRADNPSGQEAPESTYIRLWFGLGTQ